MRKKQIGLRCWIDIDGARFFGPGRAELLGLIGEEGSISKAARKMGMSYKKAWDMVDAMNNMSQKPLVTSRKGGENGGGAELTEAGKKVISRYEVLIKKLNTVIENETEILRLI